MNPTTVFDFEDVTRITNGNIKVIGIFRSVKDENTRVPSILIAAFFLIQAKKALASLLAENELSPTEIISLQELDKRTRRISDEIKVTTTPDQFNRAIELIRTCANSKDLNPAIWSRFASELDIQTILQEVDFETDYDFSVLFPKEQRNIALVVRKSVFNMLYQAADQTEKSLVSQASESFCNKRDCKKAKLALARSNEFIEDILDNADRNRLVDLFRDELTASLA